MAFTTQPGTLANLQNSLKRIYDPEFFSLMQNVNAPGYKMLLEAKNVVADGEGYFWPFYMGTPQNMGAPAEGNDPPPSKQRIEVQARVRPTQMINTFKISFIMAAIGTKRGTFGKAEVQRQIEEATIDITKHLNRTLLGSHGSGRLGQIEANNGGAVTITMKKPLGAWLLRKKMLIDVYTLDTAGAISSSGAATQIEVTGVNYSTRVVTLGTSITVLANEHVYVYPDYNNTINGFAGLFDDGTNLTTIHNQSRSTYEDLKATVSAGVGGVLRPLTEELMIDLAANVLQTSGEEIDTFVMNSGQIRQYLRFVIPNRRYNIDGKGVPAYQTGYKEADLQFFAGGNVVAIKRFEDVSPRVIYGFCKKYLRKFETEKLDWIRHGGDRQGGILTQGIGAAGRNTTYEAAIYVVTNAGYMKPNAAGVARDLLDPQMLGDPAE